MGRGGAGLSLPSFVTIYIHTTLFTTEYRIDLVSPPLPRLRHWAEVVRMLPSITNRDRDRIRLHHLVLVSGSNDGQPARLTRAIESSQEAKSKPMEIAMVN